PEWDETPQWHPTTVSVRWRNAHVENTMPAVITDPSAWDMYLKDPQIGPFLKELYPEPHTGEDLGQRLRAGLADPDGNFDLSGLELTSLPPELFEAKTVKALDISQNNFETIPADIARLTDLEVLVAHNNPIHSVHADIGQLEHLRAVMLHQCDLPKFPHALLRCRSLQNLQLEGNRIKWIPMQITQALPSLDQLDVRNNPVLNLPADLHQCSVARLIEATADWEPIPRSEQQVVLAIGLDYDETLPNLNRELEVIQKAIIGAGLQCVDLYNPDSVNLFRTIYQFQHITAILHIGAFHLHELRRPDTSRVPLEPGDLMEMFRCMRSEGFNTQLVVLNVCDTEPMINDELLPDHFNLVIGMPGKVSDDMALAFSEEFYRALASGERLGDAFELARIKLGGETETNDQNTVVA
ncbi:MAG: hypothetical protein R3301_19935, partial [Saprospiraceae bacterium]|nr:hypothetical protein [Saprospiraceae bacterium]